MGPQIFADTRRSEPLSRELTRINANFTNWKEQITPSFPVACSPFLASWCALLLTSLITNY